MSDNKFIPIIVKDKELLKIIGELHKQRNGFSKIILDIAKARSEVSYDIHRWFIKIIKKYKIPEKYEDNLTYNHETHKITLKD